MSKTLEFYKYEGAGNDFILFDAREGAPMLSHEELAHLCHRHFGIGADGVMYLEQPQNEGEDFYMRYFNSDGRESTMCGNGGRCISKFAADLGMFSSDCKFSAVDGPHWAKVNEHSITLGMVNAPAVVERNGGHFVDTGSPHHVEQRDFPADFENVARQTRDAYGAEGSNVNYVETIGEDALRIRTFERGVEAETLACGTGAVAAAIVAYTQGWVQTQPVTLDALGGQLKVGFEGRGPFTKVWLEGPAKFVFKGTITL